MWNVCLITHFQLNGFYYCLVFTDIKNEKKNSLLMILFRVLRNVLTVLLNPVPVLWNCTSSTSQRSPWGSLSPFEPSLSVASDTASPGTRKFCCWATSRLHWCNQGIPTRLGYSWDTPDLCAVNTRCIANIAYLWRNMSCCFSPMWKLHPCFLEQKAGRTAWSGQNLLIFLRSHIPKTWWIETNLLIIEKRQWQPHALLCCKTFKRKLSALKNCPELFQWQGFFFGFWPPR